MMKLYAAILATCATAFAPVVSHATPVFFGSFTGVAKDSVDGTGNIDGTVVTGTFSFSVTGPGDSSSPTHAQALVGGSVVGPATYSMTVNAAGQSFEFDDLRTLYLVNTQYPGGGAESELEANSTAPAGLGSGFDFFGDILRSSSFSDVVPGPIDLAKSSIHFGSSPTLKAGVQLTGVFFGTSEPPATVPEPSTLWLVPLACAALFVVIRKRA